MRNAIRPVLLATVLALMAAACSAPASEVDTADSLSSSSSSSLSGDAPKPPPDGPVAPDFTMALESGGTFTLSDAAKPVYMVFWAEW